MNDLDESRTLGALAYGITVLPASVAASGFFSLGVPGLVWVALAALGGALGGGLFWARHPLLGAVAFGAAGAMSPFITALYVEDALRRNATPWGPRVEFSLVGLFAGPLVLLLGASVFMLVAGYLAERRR